MTSQALKLCAVTAFGLESVVIHELQTLGFADARGLSTGRVGFSGTLADLGCANLWLRSAERVLIEVGRFPAANFDDLFEGVQQLPWEQWIGQDAGFPVSGRSVRSTLSSVPAIQRATKKAIVQRLMDSHKTAELPETGPTYPVEVALHHDQAVLTIDSTGAGLHKRGYRRFVGDAQIRETMAAALVQLSFWKPDRALIDPFCGTGTIPIEAAMIARNIAPGLRRSFAFENWPQIDRAQWQSQRRDAEDAMTPPLSCRLIGTDIDDQALDFARIHARQAGVEDDIHWQNRPFEDLRAKARFGCIITNPPWGTRLGDHDSLEALYRSFPEVLKRLDTWSHFILTGYPGFEKLIGQRANRRRKLYSANIETTYYQFHGPHPEATRIEPDDTVSEPLVMPVFGGLTKKAHKQAEMFATILQKHARHLRKWPDRGISCYRLYDRDFPEVPLVVDRYEEYLHIAEYDRPHDRTPSQHADWLDFMVQTACEALEVDPGCAFLKKRSRQRHRHDLGGQYERVSTANKRTVVQEHGLRLEVNLSDYVDTGLFLDHRNTRQMVRQRAANKRFLNLFGYTGSFTVFAAAGGASATTTVDLSGTYLDWCERNLLLNNFNGPEHNLVQADAMSYLKSLTPGAHFDLAVVDPPTFSNSKRIEQDWDVQSDHTRLIDQLVSFMDPGGLIYFSTNARSFKSFFPDCVAAKEITNQTIPEDFRNKKIHRCWILRPK